MKTKYLFMSLGHAGSGKTYFTERLAMEIDAVRLNADALRMNLFGSFDAAKEFDAKTGYLNQVVFNALEYAIVQILKSDNSVIYDVQHNEKVIRDKTAKLAMDNGAIPVIIWIKTPVDIALRRGQDRDLTPDQQKHDYETMKALIEKHQRLLDHPTSEERVITIDGTIPFEEQYNSFRDQLKKV